MTGALGSYLRQCDSGFRQLHDIVKWALGSHLRQCDRGFRQPFEAV